MIALESDRRWVHGLKSRKSCLLQVSLQKDKAGSWIGQWRCIIQGGFSEGLQAEQKKRFGSREEKQLRTEQRENNHCQKHSRGPEVRHPSHIKLQYLMPHFHRTIKSWKGLGWKGPQRPFSSNSLGHGRGQCGQPVFQALDEVAQGTTCSQDTPERSSCTCVPTEMLP